MNPADAGNVLLQYGIAGAVLFILTVVLVTYVFKYALPQTMALQAQQKAIDASLQQRLMDDLAEARKSYDAELRKQREEAKASNIEQREWLMRENQIWRDHVVRIMDGFASSIGSMEKTVDRVGAMHVALAETLGAKHQFLNKVQLMTGETGLHKKYETNQTQDSMQ